MRYPPENRQALPSPRCTLRDRAATSQAGESVFARSSQEYGKGRIRISILCSDPVRLSEISTRVEATIDLMYIGDQWRLHAPNNCTRTYQTDTSGEIEYLFDESGYRRTCSDTGCALTFYVSGCSLTFGVGLAESDTWPAILARDLRRDFDIPVRYRNFAQGGASNDYVARSLLMECQIAQPDIVIAQFTYKNRTEYNGGGIPGEMIGPWCTQEHVLHYYAYYSDRDGVIGGLKNLLLLQLFCETREIEFYYSSEDRDLLNISWPEDNRVTRLYRDSISAEGRVDSRIWNGPSQDLAKDGWHPGRTQQARHALSVKAALERTSQALRR